MITNEIAAGAAAGQENGLFETSETNAIHPPPGETAEADSADAIHPPPDKTDA